MKRDDDIERGWGNLVIWGPFSSVTSADLDAVERAIGRALPRDYREFIEVAHGGTLQYAVRLPPGDPDGHLAEFSQFFLAVGDGPGTLVHEWRTRSESYFADLLPDLLLPVALDGGGSTLFLDLGDESHGTVWAYVHGLPVWAGGGDQDRGGVVARSWSEYLDLLVIDEDMAREIWEPARDGAEPGALASVVHWLDAGMPGWRSQSWAGDPP